MPYWRAILDDHQRVMVAIAFNNDLADSYQWQTIASVTPFDR